MDSYYDTAKRMYQSSKTLHNSGEYHNACYTAGYIVECYAKIIVGLHHGYTLAQIKSRFSHSLTGLDANIVQYILQNSQYAQYSRNLANEFSHLMGWNPYKRYVQQSGEWNSIASNNIQSQIPLAMQLLAQMSNDLSTNLI